MMAEGQPTHYYVFLSHNSRDKGFVEPLGGMLAELGLSPFLDQWHLVSGESIGGALMPAETASDEGFQRLKRFVPAMNSSAPNRR